MGQGQSTEQEAAERELPWWLGDREPARRCSRHGKTPDPGRLRTPQSS